MFSTFIYAFEAVMPLVLLIFLGYFLRRIGFFSENFLTIGYRFSFRIALPCMLFCNVYSIESLSAIDFRTVVYAVVAVCVLFVVGLLAALLFVPDRRQRGVVTQCFFRSNSAIVGVSLTQALGGVSALQCVAVITAFTIPLFNILAVVALSVFVESERGLEKKRGLGAIRWGKIGLNILKNPLIIGIGLGFLCLAVRALLPVNEAGEAVFMLSKQGKVLFSLVEGLAQIASPFMLLMLGGQFTFSAVKGMKKQIVLGTIGRILLAPVFAIGVGYLLSSAGVLRLGTAEYASFIALFASPVAVSSAIMAREMGNDDVLAGQLVVWTSIGSVFTLFLFAVVFRTVGLL
ncbi:MAG: AEC family transporter [Clostridia bacterium]|nr:AEC family transporter [Clostridia bacterium]